ncbi:MAG: helix-turn-helix domain-containing protein [Armatimonadia bacterium]|nr:helix-turn-helix domain-containing protein [Armatimonadia bacterium]
MAMDMGDNFLNPPDQGGPVNGTEPEEKPDADQDREPEESGEPEKAPRLPQAADGTRRSTKRVSYAQLAREQKIRRAASRASAQRDQHRLPLDLPPRKKRSKATEETREELLDRLLDPELTLAETAKLLEVCPATVRRYADKGVLPHHRTPGNQRRFKLRDVLDYLERQDRSVQEDVGDE